MNDELEEAVIASTPQRPKSPKKMRTPELVNDLHPGTNPPFKTYADARGVSAGTSVISKFLVVASWLFEERSETPVTADRVFTCFRFVRWPFNIDFDQPLRDLKRKNFLEQKGKATFSITHLGLDQTTKMLASTRNGA